MKSARPPHTKTTKLRPLEFRIWREISPEFPTAKTRLILGFSGGRDSVALALVFKALALRMGLRLCLVHVHHGASSSPLVTEAREKAVEFSKDFAREQGLKLHVVRPSKAIGELRSEAALRKFRHHALREVAKKEAASLILLAHHADDLLETRLIRLIRGTSAAGLEAMRARRGPLFRPFLGVSRRDLEEYLQDVGVAWHEDPSNEDRGPLRNWLRRAWLPELEAKRSGAVKALARSLENLAQSVSKTTVPIVNELSRATYLELSLGERREWLSRTLLRLGARAVSTAHLAEIVKRVESSRRTKQQFEMLGVEIFLDAKQISLRKKLLNV